MMSVKMIVASPDASFSEVWQIIFKKGIHGLPVVDKDNILLGIIAEEDLLSRLYSRYRLHPLVEKYLGDFFPGKRHEEREKRLQKLTKLRAKDVMNENVFTTTAEAPILKALASMMVHRVRQFPVITKKREVIGMVTKGDIFDSLFKKYLRPPKIGSLKRKKTRNSHK